MDRNVLIYGVQTLSYMVKIRGMLAKLKVVVETRSNTEIGSYGEEQIR